MPGIKNKNIDLLLFGDGSDGDLTVTLVLAVLSDKNYRNLTVNKGAIVYSNGHKIRVSDTLIISGSEISREYGYIQNNGTNALASIGSVDEVLASYDVFQYVPGAQGNTLGPGGYGAGGMYNGGRGIGHLYHPRESGSGVFVNYVYGPVVRSYSLGGAGGQGGDAVSGSLPAGDYYRYRGGLGASLTPTADFSGTISSSMGSTNSFFTAVTAAVIGNADNSSSLNLISGGGGGGAGASFSFGVQGSGRPRSGQGAGGAGVVYIAAKKLIVNGRITAIGGNGGNTYFQNGGGGGAGGGVVIVVYSEYEGGDDLRKKINVSGGKAGVGQLPFHDMTGSQPGGSGSILLFKI